MHLVGTHYIRFICIYVYYSWSIAVSLQVLHLLVLVVCKARLYNIILFLAKCMCMHDAGPTNYAGTHESLSKTRLSL